MALGNLEHY